MKKYDDLKTKVLSEAPTIDGHSLNQLISESPIPPIIIDVRERDEIDNTGIIPGAITIPRGLLEMQIGTHVPLDSQNVTIVIYCVNGERAAFCVRSLEEMGYYNVFALNGGFNEWARLGYPIFHDVPLTIDQRLRYKRHLLLPEIGEDGQKKLLNASVCIIGAGGLGSPASMYLAACGIGRIGICDYDLVDLSNLQRQIIHGEETVGIPKAQSAGERISHLNSDIQVETFNQKLSPENIDDILHSYDIIVDATDSFPTKYLLNDYCVEKSKYYVWGSISQYQGQTMVVSPGHACYRCLYPSLPEHTPTSNDAVGVFGILPGLIGVLQATAVIKIITGLGTPMTDKLLFVDLKNNRFCEINVDHDPACTAKHPKSMGAPHDARYNEQATAHAH